MSASTKVTEGTAFITADAKEAEVYCIPKKVKPWSTTGLQHKTYGTNYHHAQKVCA